MYNYWSYISKRNNSGVARAQAKFIMSPYEYYGYVRAILKA